MKADTRLILEGKIRDELIIIARKLKIHKCRLLNKNSLISAILSCEESLVRRNLSISWWDRYHNHVYGIATIISVILAIAFFVIQQNAANPNAVVSPDQITILVDEIVSLKTQLTSISSDPLSLVALRHGISEYDLRALINGHAEALENKPSLKQEYIRTLFASEQYEKAANEANILIANIHKKRETLLTDEQELKYAEVDALNVCGMSLLELGKAHDAVEQYQKANHLMADEIGHERWVSTQKGLAMALFAVGRREEALRLYLEAYGKQPSTMAEEHRFEDATNLGHLTMSFCDYQNAENFFAIALNTAKDKFPRSDIRIAITMLAFSQVALEQGDYKKAEVVVRKYLGFLQETEKLDTVYAAAGFYTLAKILRLSGRSEKAIEFYGRALDIYKAALGDEHLQVAMTYNDIGLCKMTEHKYAEAIEDFDKAISMAKAYNYDDLQISMFIANRGRALFNIGQMPAARSCFQQALNLRKNCLDEENPLINDMRELIYKTYGIKKGPFRNLVL